MVAKCYRPGMSQPVKVSDALLLDARLAAETVERSIAGQIEFWARLGRALEPLLQGTQVMALCRNSAARPLSACLEAVDSPKGRRQLAEFLSAQPYPHYEPVPNGRGLLLRLDQDGTRTVGRFVKRQFRAIKGPRARS
jgi:hypothetical protein